MADTDHKRHHQGPVTPFEARLVLPILVTSNSWPSLAFGKSLWGQPNHLFSVTRTFLDPNLSQRSNAIWSWSRHSNFTHLSNRLRTILITCNSQCKAMVITTWYCMASFMNGQDTINQILHCNRLPKQRRWCYLAHSGLPPVSCKKKFSDSHIINLLLTNLVQSRWVDIGLILHCP